MDNLTLLETLKTKSMTFSLEEIQEIMDEELNKNPEEMDTELIDLCAEVLDKAYFNSAGETATGKNECEENSENVKTGAKRIKFGRIVLIAAIIMIVFSISIPVGAKYVHNEASDKIVQFFSDHFNLNLRDGNQDAVIHSNENIDLIDELENAGFEEIIIPSVFLEKNYSKDDITVTEDEMFLSVEISVKLDNKTNGYVGITKHKTEYTKDILGQGEIGAEYDSAKQIQVNGMDVIIFSSNEQAYIRYVDNNTEYTIALENCDLDLGVEIAKSLE